jgi:hypothetical protein
VGFYPFREPDASWGALPAYYNRILADAYSTVDVWEPRSSAAEFHALPAFTSSPTAYQWSFLRELRMLG